MRWRRLRRSDNVDDVRGQSPRGAGLPLRIGGKGGGITTIVIILAVLYFGGPEMLTALLGGGAPAGPTQSGPQSRAPIDDEAGDFVAAVLGSTEDVWNQIFGAAGSRYAAPRLTLFSGAVNSACGYNTAAVGPFYCPPDRRVYLDTSFFDDLARLGGPGDFAQAYVIGHEVGHHVQNLLGTAERVRAAQARGSQVDANRLQVAMELQADCFAGVWAHHANRRDANREPLLEPGDVEEGLAAAAAIGDDRLQRSAGRRVSPESFTHGTSTQRQAWLRRGLESGSPDACDTFAGP